MPTSRNSEPLLVQIPPSTSPLLVPADSRPHSHAHAHSHRYSNSQDSFTLNQRNPDIPDDLEFVAPGQWDEAIGQFREDDDDEDNLDRLDDDDDDDHLLDEDDDIEDWTLEEGHIEGVPCANLRMNAKLYQSTEFLQQLFNVLRHDLAIPGWAHLPIDTPPTLIQVHKVSGSLTNAVFFVSIPETPIELDHIEPLDFDQDVGTPVLSTSQARSPTDDSPPFSPLSPATVFQELEKSRHAASTPTPADVHPDSLENPATPSASIAALPALDDPRRDRDASSSTTRPATEQILFSAPTLLLRIYGPSSGSLISRRNELHILHTLSSQYGIGPRVLGTFANGRVEEYFHSRALVKEEMRDPRISRWIGRRMRELHSVDLDQMIRPPTAEELARADNNQNGTAKPTGDSASHQSEEGEGVERPSIDRNLSSGASVHSISSNSSMFSFGASSSSSSYSYSSNASSIASNSTIGSPSSLHGMPRSVVSSPSLLPQRPALESRASSKKRTRRKMGASSRRHQEQPRPKLCVWENITRWTREAKLVLSELDQLASVPGFSRLLDRPVRSLAPSRTTSSDTVEPAASSNTNSSSTPNGDHIPPLASPSRTLDLRAALNLPLFEQQLRLYRAFVHKSERSAGRSKRVFAHNDTQYGNLLLLTPDKGGLEEQELEQRVKREGGNHKRIIVVDFEYAGANPRAFDIANHFCEWQADYHHESLSHSLSAHQPYPTRAEKTRFLRAYVGCDGGFDHPDIEAEDKPVREDPRVERLLEEVKVWEPSSHAMWAVWGIVQAKEDLLARIEGWKEKALSRSSRATSQSPEPQPSRVDAKDLVHELEDLKLQQAKAKPESGPEPGDTDDADDEEDDDEWEKVEGEVFDYLSYAAERMDMFRRELTSLGVI
ncbi:uncharacterized protein JCM15063_000074 [Sporobolomyces koalae]|uniref:uncharacterized protein n=1 Tax=Sporobolomyces koalae TaxID=500713 RepID=UPI00316B4A0F